MRLYTSRMVPAKIQQKTISTKYGVKARSLTADDFEIVPEHEEQELIGCRCDVCGCHGQVVDVEKELLTLFCLEVIDCEHDED